MRHRFLRERLKEIFSATILEKIAIIIPFIVLLWDIEIFYYSLVNRERYIFIFSIFVLILSSIEIIVVIEEIHQHFGEIRKKRALRKIVKKIVDETEERYVKEIVRKVIKKHPEYSISDIYHVACELLNEKTNLNEKQ
ncbi:MAG: hypothetical protein H5T44_04505 [Thermoplasmatales archaeon]|nr:hypothetical protein [Thermoplasmatales archaeon]